MRRISLVGIVALIVALASSGCGASGTGGAADKTMWTMPELAAADLADGGKLRVVATTSIVGDIVRNVGGEAIELSVLLPVGTDPHAFSATPQDVATVSEADVVMANGAGLEEFLASLIQSVGNVPVAPLSDGVALREGTAGADHGGEQGAPATDPHTWTTPANALIFVQNAEKALSALDPAHAETYAANAAAYSAQLQEMDAWIQTQIDTIPQDQRKLVTDHETFGYYCDRYGLKQVGAVVPAYTSEASTSAQDLAALEDTMRAEGVRAVFIGNSANPHLADTLAADLGVQVVPLYVESLGAVGSGAETYLDYLRYNTSAIVSALQ